MPSDPARDSVRARFADRALLDLDTPLHLITPELFWSSPVDLRKTGLVYVILYVPSGAEPEIFGPFSTFQQAVNILRSIAGAAGHQLEAPASGLMASIDLLIDGESHRYQLLKLGSADQVQIHASVIEELARTANVELSPEGDISPPGRLSGY